MSQKDANQMADAEGLSQCIRPEPDDIAHAYRLLPPVIQEPEPKVFCRSRVGVDLRRPKQPESFGRIELGEHNGTLGPFNPDHEGVRVFEN